MREPAGWPTVTFHPSQHPERLADELARALKLRKLPAKFHFLTPQQARRWLAVHAAHAPSGGALAATTAAYREVFQDLARQLRNLRVQIVSLGCGGGQKDALLAGALHREGCALRYLAVDAGQAFVLMAADAVTNAAPPCVARRLVADLDKFDGLRGFIEQDSKPDEVQLYCAFGVTPNTDANRLIEWLARESVSDDHLLINANLYDPDDPEHDLPATLTQYDNAETRRWLATFFADLDWPVLPDHLVFCLHEQESPARISANLILQETHSITINSETFEVPGGACLEVFLSNRFRPTDLTAMLARSGFGCCRVQETAKSAEVVWHVRRI